ncbi:divalent-cation tolerance protein CutA [Saccharobesus litoralis]|uniref:Divalent-cation tolerance protein CutA n=1 Tax=Saccharobesus litoralis TaxID=2172099 RepID=A0A2S0VNH7_9ALTE|nr:divalent-cation tolerance protein CutA [Saccharobesus litoralis]AWB65729.1 divalent-cation tolerance protein CutA [Saccharobesus litoralis]
MKNDIQADTPILVFCTTPTKQEAQELANGIVRHKHAACVNIVDAIESVYSWQGRIVMDNEYLLKIKTLGRHFEGLQAFIKSQHSYDVPEITAVNMCAISDEYAQWLIDSLTPSSNQQQGQTE